MEEIITNEWIAYKAGFFETKNELAEKLYFGEFCLFKREELNDVNWYSYGYQDCCAYFEEVEQKCGKVSSDMLHCREKIQAIMKDYFVKRVVQFNQNQEKKVAISKFRMN